MTNEFIAIFILIALGFAFIINKLNRIRNMAEFLVSAQVGNIVIESADGRTLSELIRDAEDEE